MLWCWKRLKARDYIRQWAGSDHILQLKVWERAGEELEIDIPPGCVEYKSIDGLPEGR